MKLVLLLHLLAVTCSLCLALSSRVELHRRVGGGRGPDRHQLTKLLKGSSNTTATLPLKLVDEVAYIVRIEVGSPGQSFDLLIDTGSFLTWIPGPDAAGTCGENKHKFAPTNSSTFKDLHKSLLLQYVKGNINLNLANETVTVGGLKIDNTTIGLAVSGTCKSWQSIDGILGLEVSGARGASSILELLPSHLDQPILSIYLGKTENDTGELELGGYRKELMAEGDLESRYINLTQKADDPTVGVKWRLDLDRVSVNGVKVNEKSIGILDTGSTTILVPTDAFLAIAAQFNTTINKQMPGHDLILMECDKVKSLPAITFTFGDKEHTLSAASLMLGTEEINGTCFNAMAFQPHHRDYWLLGQPFLRNFYSIFDFGNRRVALAPLRDDHSAALSVHGTAFLSLFVLLLVVL